MLLEKNVCEFADHFGRKKSWHRIARLASANCCCKGLSLDPLLTAIGALVGCLPLAVSRIIATEARSIWRNRGGLKVQRTRQHVGVAAKTPLGVEAGG